MKKEILKEFSTIILALFVGYATLVFVAFLSHTDTPVTGYAISNTITEKDASLALGKSREIIEEMSKAGLGTSRANDLIEEARREMNLKNYGNVIVISDEIANLKQKALKIQEQIKNTTTTIVEFKKLGFDAVEAEALLNLSIIEFALENYEGSEEHLKSSIKKLNDLTKSNIRIILENLNYLKNYSLEKNINISRLESTIIIAQNSLENLDEKKVKVLTQELTNLNKSINILIEVKNDINAMSEAGIGINRVNAILNEAKFALELGYYDKIESIAKNINDLKSKAFDIEADIKKTKSKIDDAKSYGLDVNEVESLLNSSINEFNLENYEDAKKLSKQSFEKANKLIADSLLFGTVSKSELRFNLINFFKRFWWLISLILIFTLILGIIAFQRISVIILKNKLRNLEKEMQAIIDLIKNVQTAYFKENKMDKSTYNLTIDKYQNRIIQIKEKIPIIRAKLDKRMERFKIKNYLIYFSLF